MESVGRGACVVEVGGVSSMVVVPVGWEGGVLDVVRVACTGVLLLEMVVGS